MSKFSMLCLFIFISVQTLVGSTSSLTEEKENYSPDMATFEEVKNIPNHPEKFLIDVRNPDELARTGVIPGSINIPLPDLERALQMSEADFKQKYGRAKPSKNAVIIFSCQSGRRASAATETARKFGFVNAKPYLGSWMEWVQRKQMQLQF